MHLVDLNLFIIYAAPLGWEPTSNNRNNLTKSKEVHMAHLFKGNVTGSWYPGEYKSKIETMTSCDFLWTNWK